MFMKERNGRMGTALILGLFFFGSVLAVCFTAVHIQEMRGKQPEMPDVAAIQEQYEKELQKNKDIPTVADVISLLNGDWDGLGGENNG